MARTGWFVRGVTVGTGQPTPHMTVVDIADLHSVTEYLVPGAPAHLHLRLAWQALLYSDQVSS